MTDRELALAYCPHILFDKAEPFHITGIGYTVFHKPGKSQSFRREVDPGEAALAIEYAVFFDYDIQHLYDLEHVWIYVDAAGQVCDAEASFHGFYLKSMALGENVLNGGTHLQIYCQPGKHAFMPRPELFKLLPDWHVCCNTLAGKEGLLVMDMFRDRYQTDGERQGRVARHIKETYAFTPTLAFEHRPLAGSLLYPWEELREMIPARIAKELAKIEG